MNHHKIVELAKSAFAADEVCVLCTVVRLDGSGYGRPGARLLLTESGDREGYISGGCLEKDLCRRVWSATERGPELIAFDTRGNAVGTSRYNTGCEGVVYVLCQRISREHPGVIDVLDAVDQSDRETRLLTIYRSESAVYPIGESFGETTGLRLPEALLERLIEANRCTTIEFADLEDNAVEAFIEVLRPRRRLVIFGAGDDVIPVAQSASIQGWQTTIVGHRPELADPNRFPGANVVCGPMHKLAQTLTRIDHADVIVMTHDFDRDVELLPALLRRDARSIGLLGPKRRLGNLVTSLYGRGIVMTEDQIKKIRSPIGLDIGAITPEEIAASIVAELIAMPCGRSGQSLHHRKSPLHASTEHTKTEIAPVPRQLVGVAS